jgi:HSP20 family protein
MPGGNAKYRQDRHSGLPAPKEKMIVSDFYFSNDLYRELDRLQRQMSGVFGGAPSSLRSSRADVFPPINIGTTDDSIEIVAFAPGLDPSNLDISIDKGLLTIAGERVSSVGPQATTSASTHMSGSAARSGAL